MFGLGKKKDEAPAQAQMSPEAMAMLAQLAQSGGAAQAQPMAPSMPAPGTAQVAATGQLTQFPSVAAAPAAPAGIELSAKEQRKQAREGKKAATAKREEKELERRRKKNSRSRFSRAKYLRESEGNALSSVILSSTLLVLTFIIPIFLNAFFLIPATKENRSIIQEVNTFRSMIEQARPILQAAVARKKERDDALTQKLAGFADGDSAAGALRRLISDLESRGAVMKSGYRRGRQQRCRNSATDREDSHPRAQGRFPELSSCPQQVRQVAAADQCRQGGHHRGAGRPDRRRNAGPLHPREILALHDLAAAR